MKKRMIGSLEVSVVGLGCNNFGSRLEYDATAAVVDTALDLGINFLDTADIYGGTRSEEQLGQVLAGRRDKIILATKFGAEINGERAGASPAYIRKAIDDSLRRLRTDRIDLYQLHRPDVTVPIADTLGTLGDLVIAGKVIEIGCSNFSLTQLREAAAISKDGHARFVSVQNELSLLHRDDEADVLPECGHQGLAYLPFFPLASGMLTGKYRGDAGKTASGRLATGGRLFDKYRSPANAAMVENLNAFAEGRGHTLLELAFSWLLAHPSLASVIAGATSPEQVRANIAAADWELDERELGEVAAIVAA